jgi:Serine carboxypeptidase
MTRIWTSIGLLLSCLLESAYTIDIKTGEGNHFYVKQRVAADYIMITDNSRAYYQYFESVNATSQKNLLVYFGNFLDKTAIREAALGLTPYFYISDPGFPNKVKTAWNPASVNQFANILVVDIVRGTGFSNSSDAGNLDFHTIAADMELVIKKFMEIIPSTASYNKNLFVYAGYMMVQPAMIFLNNTKMPFKGIFANTWLGYPSIDQLHVTMPAYGYTDRNQLDDISNKIYGLQVKDYSKDIDEMFADLTSITRKLDENGFIDFNNPTLSQNQAYAIQDGFFKFYNDCVSCKIYVNMYKKDWNVESNVMNGLKKEIIMDTRQKVIETCVSLSKNEQSVNKSFIMLEGGNSVKTSIQSLEDATVKNFMEDNSLIYGVLRMAKISLPLTGNAKLNIEECPDCGFYPLIEQEKGATTLVSFYSFIYETAESKHLENEFNYQTQLLKNNAKLFN